VLVFLMITCLCTYPVVMGPFPVAFAMTVGQAALIPPFIGVCLSVWRLLLAMPRMPDKKGHSES
jgi:hypothetical protein